MEEIHNEAAVRTRGGRRVAAAPSSGKKPLLIAGIVLAVLLAAYVALCAYAASSKTIWKNTVVLGQDIGGMTAEEAGETLKNALPGMQIQLYLYPADGDAASHDEAADAAISAQELGAVLTDPAALAQAAQAENTNGSFLTMGWRYLTHKGLSWGAAATQHQLTLDETNVAAVAEVTAQSLSYPAQDTSYQLNDSTLTITRGVDGRSVSAEELQRQLNEVLWDDLTLDIPYTVESANDLSAQEISDVVSSKMKNAGYDAATGSIYPEQVGAEFDVSAAQTLLDSAAPGESVDVPATVEYPAVTAQQLKGVLFRDVLGRATTHVGGTSARISNVKLSASSINGTVLNCGDVFSYNGTVGQRTAARGYQAAPAYVKGETVDEIGGGICQTSSTLYLACLNSNLSIVERYAHRYAPSYISWGMDATVSWGGPDYKFSNNTDYPVKIAASYSKGYLTVTLYGTKTDSTTVKMTNKVLSDTEWTTVYEDDNTLPAGTEKVKTTPYTGHKVESYRNLYDGNGKLISSRLEAVSDYKVRNKVVLRGPAKTETPVSGENGASSSGSGSSSGSSSDNSGSTGSGGTETTPPASGGETVTPTEPGDSGGFIVITPEEQGNA